MHLEAGIQKIVLDIDIVISINTKYRGSLNQFGARCSSVVRAFGHGAMGRRIDPLSYFSFHPVFHDWMVHIKDPLLLSEMVLYHMSDAMLPYV